MTLQQLQALSDSARRSVHEESCDKHSWLNALLPPLPCAGSYWGCRYIRRFHIPTCLFCRWRRAAAGKWANPPFWIDYTYLSMSWFWSPARAKVNGEVWVGWLQVPTTLKIDPRGHFTRIRCGVIVALDKLAAKLRLRDNHRIANICEFLACYPTW